MTEKTSKPKQKKPAPAGAPDRAEKLASLLAKNSPRDAEVKQASEAVLADTAQQPDIAAPPSVDPAAKPKKPSQVCRESISMSPQEQAALNSLLVKVTAKMGKPVGRSAVIRAAIAAFADAEKSVQLGYVRKAI